MCTGTLSLLLFWLSSSSLKLLLRLGVVVSVVVVEVSPPRAELVRDEPEGAGVSALAADGLIVVSSVGVAALHANAEASSEVVLEKMDSMDSPLQGEAFTRIAGFWYVLIELCCSMPACAWADRKLTTS